MTHPPVITRAYAFDLRRLDTGDVVGVGLVAPSHQYVSLLAEGDAAASTPELSAETWRDITAWATDGDSRLPAKPAPMGTHIVGALVGAGEASTVSTERFAAIPLLLITREELASLANGLLPDLLRVRQVAS